MTDTFTIKDEDAPRLYRRYAQAHRRSVHEQVIYDQGRWPGNIAAGFLIWNLQQKLRAGAHPGSGVTADGQVMYREHLYDNWLVRHARVTEGIPQPSQFIHAAGGLQLGQKVRVDLLDTQEEWTSEAYEACNGMTGWVVELELSKEGGAETHRALVYFEHPALLRPQNIIRMHWFRWHEVTPVIDDHAFFAQVFAPEDPPEDS